MVDDKNLADHHGGVVDLKRWPSYVTYWWPWCADGGNKRKLINIKEKRTWAMRLDTIKI